LIVAFVPSTFLFSGYASKNQILIDRDTGEFYGRLESGEDNSDNSSFMFEDRWINHFQYEVADGLPLEWQFTKPGEMDVAGKNGNKSFIKQPFTLHFNITEREQYVAAYKKLRQNEALMWKDINEPLAGLQETLDAKFDELLKKEDPKIRPWLFGQKEVNIENAEKAIGKIVADPPKTLITAKQAFAWKDDPTALANHIAIVSADYSASLQKAVQAEVKKYGADVLEYAFSLDHAKIREREQALQSEMEKFYQAEIAKRYNGTWFSATFDSK
jgi:succinate dehydrogenase flavin-adding protein (antitoxin of CptAB toxin-antitoxin module)